MNGCPNCGARPRIGRLLIWSGLPSWRCERCGERLRWRRGSSLIATFLIVAATIIVWWQVGLMFGDTDSLLPILLWPIWTWVMSFVLAIGLSQLVGFEVCPEPAEPKIKSEDP